MSDTCPSWWVRVRVGVNPNPESFSHPNPVTAKLAAACPQLTWNSWIDDTRMLLSAGDAQLSSAPPTDHLLHQHGSASVRLLHNHQLKLSAPRLKIASEAADVQMDVSHVRKRRGAACGGDQQSTTRPPSATNPSRS